MKPDYQPLWLGGFFFCLFFFASSLAGKKRDRQMYSLVGWFVWIDSIGWFYLIALDLNAFELNWLGWLTWFTCFFFWHIFKDLVEHIYCIFIDRRRRMRWCVLNCYLVICIMFIYVFTVWSIGSSIVNIMWQVCQWQVSKLIQMVISWNISSALNLPAARRLWCMFPRFFIQQPTKRSLDAVKFQVKSCHSMINWTLVFNCTLW